MSIGRASGTNECEIQFESPIVSRKHGCFIYNNGSDEYDCHSQYKSSLFVNTAGPDEENFFIVSDYEVFTYN